MMDLGNILYQSVTMGLCIHTMQELTEDGTRTAPQRIWLGNDVRSVPRWRRRPVVCLHPGRSDDAGCTRLLGRNSLRLHTIRYYLIELVAAYLSMSSTRTPLCRPEL
jgi:hypothetical protein